MNTLKSFLRLALLIAISATAAQSQSGSPYMDRARASLTQGLGKIAQWQTTHVINQTVMQCTSCLTPITVVLRHIDDYTKGSDFSRPADLYLAGRRQLCQGLVADAKGRCVSLTDASSDDLRPSIQARSIEGRGKSVFEFVMPLGPDMLAGYVEGPEEATDLPAIEAAMMQAVGWLHPLR